jgi:hypothetical protein
MSNHRVSVKHRWQKNNSVLFTIFIVAPMETSPFQQCSNRREIREDEVHSPTAMLDQLKPFSTGAILTIQRGIRWMMWWEG